MFDRSPINSAKRKPSHTYLDYENSPEHVELTERLCKTLYYGYNTPPDYPSLPLSEITVKFFQDAAPRSLGKVDMYLASSMTKHAMMSPCSVMLGIIYVNRLKDKNPEYLMQISSADLFLISMMMASKYLYDEGVYEEVFNEDWAVVGMMETADINQLEQDFLAALDWRLMVHEHEFKQLLDTIEKKIAFHESYKRGWLSYTDVWTLTQGSFYGDICKHMGQELAKMFAVSTVAYVAGVLTLLTSSYLAVSMTSRLTALTQQPTVLPELPFNLPVISHEAVSSVNFLGMRKDIGCDLHAMSLPFSVSPAWLLPSSVSSISSFLYQMMVASSLEYVSYGFPGDLNFLWRQSDESKHHASDALHMKGQKTDNGVLISSGQEELSPGKLWTPSALNYDQNPNPVVRDENLLYTAEIVSPLAVLATTSTASSNGNSYRYLSENQPLAPSQISNSSAWSEKGLSVDELPKMKYPAISTALLNLVTLFSLKTSPSSNQESKQESGHCKHCENARRSAARLTAEIKPCAADPLSNYSHVSVSSKRNLLAKCSWSQWHSERKSNSRQNQLSSDVNPIQSKNVPSRLSTIESSSGSSSSLHPSFLYNPGATSPAYVPYYLKKNDTLFSLPSQTDPHHGQTNSNCFQLTGLHSEGGLFNQSLSLRSLTATFLMGSRVKEKSKVTAPVSNFGAHAFTSTCTGMAYSRLGLWNQANMATCHC